MKAIRRNHRYPTVILAAAIGLSSMAATACGGDDQSSDATSHEEDFTSRVKEYNSLAELEKDAKVVAVGRLSGGFRLNPYYGDKETPFAIVDFEVEESFKGKVRPGELVELSLEAGITKDGGVHSDKLSPDETYLLYLVPQGPKSPSTYTIVGYLAGIYEKSTADDERAAEVFSRVDHESPELPEEVNLSDVEQAVP